MSVIVCLAGVDNGIAMRCVVFYSEWHRMWMTSLLKKLHSAAELSYQSGQEGAANSESEEQVIDVECD